ncbi:MAG TPA: hypothetical protein VFN35_09990 [Ktedonobacteraceae bacterium]|nr:hypothetical protein [Ktedonobacteraceae bacterium]
MVIASKNHWKNGFFLQKGGYEYTMVLVAAGLVVGLIGPGNYSLDTLFGIALPEALLFSVLAVAALVVDIIGMIMTTRHHLLVSPEGTSNAS